MTNQKLIIEKAIRYFECMKSDAQVVLDSGFGTHEGESDLVYKNRKIYAQMAIEALEKQVPKKMDMYSEGHTGDLIYKCPTCGEAYNRFYEGKPHCMFCGQKILWEEEE